MTSVKKYSMAFTTGGLLLRESVVIAAQYSELKDWKEVRRIVVAENLLQSRTESSLLKITGEVIKRLKYLSDSELEFLSSADSDNQAKILWIAICKCYTFIYDFSIEVIREKFLTLYTEVSFHDYDNFFNQKADWHDELDKLSTQSREKLRQVLFKMLRDVGILSKDKQIIPSLLSTSFIQVVKKSSGKYLDAFPVTDSQIRDYMS